MNRSDRAEARIDQRVVFMTHYIPLYQVRVFQQIAARVRDFHVLLSTPIEPNRSFRPDWADLDVTVQKTITLRRDWRDRSGFQDPLYVHFPVDTRRQLRRLNPDIVMSLELGARSVGAAAYCRRYDRKLVLCTYMSEHTERDRGKTRGWLRRRLTRRADAITYNGPSCYRYLHHRLRVPDSKLFPLSYAADDRVYGSAEAFDCLEDRKRPVVSRGRLLCIGQLSERKGVVPLARQIANYGSSHPDRELHVTFVGEGPKEAELRSITTPANVTLELLGHCPAANLPCLLTEHAAVIAPTLADEWLLVVDEAMHRSTPVIGSCYAQAVESLIDDGVNGWKYDPLEPRTLSDTLDRYFATPDDQFQSLRHAAQASVAHRTPEWAARGAVAALRELAGPIERSRSPMDRSARSDRAECLT